MPYKDPEKQKEFQVRWKAEHPEKIREYGQESEKRETTKATRKRYRKSEAGKQSSRRRQKKYLDSHGGYTAATKEYPSRLPDAQRNAYYRHEHGITVEEFEAQILKQGGMCPIGNHPFGPRGKGKTSPCQDHDHETDENRLILCREHNVGLGQFHDSIFELQQAILYLESFKETTGETQCRIHLPSEGKSLELSN